MGFIGVCGCASNCVYVCEPAASMRICGGASGAGSSTSNVEGGGYVVSGSFACGRNVGVDGAVDGSTYEGALVARLVHVVWRGEHL